MTVPIFQTPDEQAHFAQLQWYAEKKTLAIDSAKNLSLEVALTEEILGTRRDERGNNKYTYHPEYKNDTEIPNMPIASRTIYVDREAAGYPPLYYGLSLPFYYGAYYQNITDRIMAARILPMILNLLLAIVAFKIGKLVWESDLFATVLAIMVVFQPMVSFVSAGIHPDNLLNLVYSAALMVCLLILKKGLKISHVFSLAILIFLGLQTKIFIVFLLPIVVAVMLARIPFLSVLVLLSPVAAYIWQLPLPYMPTVTSQSPLVNMNFWEYLKFRVPKIAFEMWPWYWGVFKWLGVVLPPLSMKVITRVAILAGIGLIVKGIRGIKGFEGKVIIFFFLSTFSYLLYLVLWDWRLMQSMGYSQGLQGRYLLPNIIPQMALLLTGPTLIKRWEKQIAIGTAVAMVILNFIAFRTVYLSYAP